MGVGSTGAERAVRLLLVEDSRTDAALVESLLEHSPAARFEVTVVDPLADGLAWLARRTPTSSCSTSRCPTASGCRRTWRSATAAPTCRWW